MSHGLVYPNNLGGSTALISIGSRGETEAQRYERDKKQQGLQAHSGPVSTEAREFRICQSLGIWALGTEMRLTGYWAGTGIS